MELKSSNPKRKYQKKRLKNAKINVLHRVILNHTAGLFFLESKLKILFLSKLKTRKITEIKYRNTWMITNISVQLNKKYILQYIPIDITAMSDVLKLSVHASCLYSRIKRATQTWLLTYNIFDVYIKDEANCMKSIFFSVRNIKLFISEQKFQLYLEVIVAFNSSERVKKVRKTIKFDWFCDYNNLLCLHLNEMKARIK